MFFEMLTKAVIKDKFLVLPGTENKVIYLSCLAQSLEEVKEDNRKWEEFQLNAQVPVCFFVNLQLLCE